MLSNKNQKYIFERLLKGQTVLYQQFDENRFAFSDGIRIFIFSKEQIKFDITKCALSVKIKECLGNRDNDKIYIPTEEIRLHEAKHKTYRKLTTEADYLSPVWVEDKFIKDYKSCTFIGYGSNYPLCALDDYGDLLAAIMPYVITGRTTDDDV